MNNTRFEVLASRLREHHREPISGAPAEIRRNTTRVLGVACARGRPPCAGIRRRGGANAEVAPIRGKRDRAGSYTAPHASPPISARA
jgi:hypothetical protein